MKNAQTLAITGVEVVENFFGSKNRMFDTFIEY